jgi:trimeric autotransporter adhesin
MPTQWSSMQTSDLVALTSSQWLSMESDDFQSLRGAQWSSIDTVDLQSLSTSQWVDFATDDLRSLSTQQWVAMATDDLRALATTQWQVMATDDLVALSTSQWAVMATDDVLALTTTQWDSVESDDKQAWYVAADDSTRDVTHARAFISTPLVIDLDGDGLELMPLFPGVRFDLLDSGKRQQIGWVASDDGLLVRDVNGNGRIDSGAELFGSSTILPSGERAADGYQALSVLDSDEDGWLSELEADQSQVLIWRDLNGDAVSQSEELFSFSDFGIVSLDLDPSVVSWWQAGQEVRLTSDALLSDGNSVVLADVWFSWIAPLEDEVVVPVRSSVLPGS